MKVHVLHAALLLTISSLCESKDHIHLQWSICDDSPDTVRDKLGILHDEPRKNATITYYDSQPPTHAQNGLMFRTKTRKGQDISAVKVRFREKTRDVPGTASCLWNRYGHDTDYICQKQAPLNGSGLWSNEQVQLAEQQERVAWKRLVAFGPYQNPKWKLRIRGHKATFDDVAAESLHLWRLKSRFLDMGVIASIARLPST